MRPTVFRSLTFEFLCFSWKQNSAWKQKAGWRDRTTMGKTHFWFFGLYKERLPSWSCSWKTRWFRLQKNQKWRQTHLSYPFVILVGSFCLLTFNLKLLKIAARSHVLQAMLWSWMPFLGPMASRSDPWRKRWDHRCVSVNPRIQWIASSFSHFFL